MFSEICYFPLNLFPIQSARAIVTLEFANMYWVVCYSLFIHQGDKEEKDDEDDDQLGKVMRIQMLKTTCMISLVLSVLPAPDSPLITTHWFSLIGNRFHKEFGEEENR